MTYRDTDLHMHTTASDGAYPPSELMRKCAKAGLKYVAVTDHDTTDGIWEAVTEAKNLGITCIPGIELSSRWRGRSIHVLGYGMNPDDEQLQNELTEQRRQRLERMQQMIEACHREGLEFSEAQVFQSKSGSLGRPHLAKVLIEEGYVSSVSEAFHRYLGEGAPCFVPKPKERLPWEMATMIRDAGGVVVLAHPGHYNMDEDVYEWLLEGWLDGIEIEHRDHSVAERERYTRIAASAEQERKRHVVRTGGSDFHHETHGRVDQQLGDDRVADQLADQLLKAVEERKNS
ncbi:hypothetical protein B0H94_101247 [Salsuginibacillus halophilus]|uniref:Polymerase/histidinol phosphatase N-terminal domain-containing protein n=1 Tax=Salsuginibacillus halophilus TaxID=517424 RepID=A0A2P8HYQ8_9BACI|nr:PHP domain-containing protein [Salsuginibacillus halophilus]PSL51333.1 hypothetical protein B0H94_101247 [Salsuginibacillus halophilus]